MTDCKLVLLHSQELRHPGSQPLAARDVRDTRTVAGCFTSNAQVSLKNHPDYARVSSFNVSSLMANIKRLINHPSAIDSIVVANLAEAIHIDLLCLLESVYTVCAA